MVKQIKFGWLSLATYPLSDKRPLDPERGINGQTRHRFGGLWHQHGSLRDVSPF